MIANTCPYFNNKTTIQSFKIVAEKQAAIAIWNALYP